MKLKKTLLGLLALAAGLPMSTSCSDDNDRILPYEYIAVQESKDGNWSFYGPDGTLRYRNEYKNRPSNVVDGYFFVREGDTTAVTLYKMDKNPRRIDAVAHVLRIGYMGSGLVPVVREGQRITLVDGEGNVKFTLNPIGSQEVICCAPRFEDGMLAIAVVDKNGRRIWGYAGTNGQTGIRPRFTDANDFRDGVAICCTSEKTYGDEAKYVIINKKGEVVKSLNKGQNPIGPAFFSGILPVRDTDGRILMLDKKGETVAKLPAKAKSIISWDKKYIVFGNDEDNLGVMNYEGEIVIRPKYYMLNIISTGRFLATEEIGDVKRALILDKDGNEELRIDNYSRGVTLMCQYGMVGLDKNSYTFLDKDGKPRKRAEFYGFGGLNPGIIYSDYSKAKEQEAEEEAEEAISEEMVTKATEIKIIDDEVIDEVPRAHNGGQQQVTQIAVDKSATKTKTSGTDDIKAKESKSAKEVVKAAVVDETSQPAKATDDGPYDMAIVEQMPQFPGGVAAMYKWLSEQIKYPASAKENGIQGRVVVQFVIGENGSISDVKVVRGTDPALDAEAIRVIKAMPRWSPGRNKGLPVKVSYNLPITFKM